MDEPRLPEVSTPSPICSAFLLKLARTPDRAKRQRILAACVKANRPWTEELLWEALADPNEAVRDFVAKELARLPGLRLEPALRRLRLPPWYARSAALRIIGRHRIAEAVSAVVQAAADANVDVRRSAAEALGEIGGEEAVRALVRLKKDTNPYVRAAAEQAIEKTSRVRFS
jgi:hypothetical protein